MTSPDDKSNHGLDPTAGPTSRDLHDIIHEALSQPVKRDRPDRGGCWGGIKTWWRKLTRR